MENLLGIKRVKGSNQKAKKPILINDLKLIINAIVQSNQTEKSTLGSGFGGDNFDEKFKVTKEKFTSWNI